MSPTPHRLKKILTLRDLVGFGVGGTIGAGIFVSIGVGAVQSGPALFLSFLLAAVACSVSGLCFCEMASRVPASGSSYSYTLHVMGDFPAFVIGSVLVLDSIISAAACARAWSAYVRMLLPFLPHKVFGDLALPGLAHMVSFSILSGVVCVSVGSVLAFGIKETTWFNNISTFANSAVLAIFVLVGLPLVDPSNWTPFAPNGLSGVVRGAGRIFFAFLGFDVVNCLAEETGSDAKAMVPRAIVWTILITTAVYVLVSVSFIGLAPVGSISLSAPLSSAFEYRNQHLLAHLVSAGAVGNTLTSVLSNFLVQPRIVLRMASDGFLPSRLGVIDDRGVPRLALLLCVSASTITAMFIDFETLADMVSVASLVSLSIVCICCVVVRVQPPPADQEVAREGLGMFYTKIGLYVLACALTAVSLLHNWFAWVPLCSGVVTLIVMAVIASDFGTLEQTTQESETGFRVPLTPVLPLLGVFVNTYLLFGLPTLALVRAGLMFLACSLYYAVRLRGGRRTSPPPTPSVTHMMQKITIGGNQTYDAVSAGE